MLLSLLVLFTLLYVIQIGIFAIGAHRSHYSHDKSYRPTVCVIIAARNEEENIRTCLNSIARLAYPKELLQVLVVDDRSTDRTGEIIREYAIKHSFITLLRATVDATGKLVGKTNAIAQAMDQSQSEIVLFTDADCAVPPHWVEETVKYFDNENVGLVAGFASLQTNNVFSGIQAIDWFVLSSVAAATIRLHFPVTAIGNNLSVRRKAYLAVGGYRAIPFSITEDYALFNAITSTKTFRAKFPIDPLTIVQSLPCTSWQQLYHQKKRWFTGGAGMGVKSILLFAVGYIFKALLLLNLVASGIGAVLLPFLLKCAADFLLVMPALMTFKNLSLLRYFIPFELYYIVYVVLFPPIILFHRNVSWKDQEFKERNA